MMLDNSKDETSEALPSKHYYIFEMQVKNVKFCDSEILAKLKQIDEIENPKVEEEEEEEENEVVVEEGGKEEDEENKTDEEREKEKDNVEEAEEKPPDELPEEMSESIEDLQDNVDNKEKKQLMEKSEQENLLSDSESSSEKTQNLIKYDTEEVFDLDRKLLVKFTGRMDDDYKDQGEPSKDKLFIDNPLIANMENNITVSLTVYDLGVIEIKKNEFLDEIDKLEESIKDEGNKSDSDKTPKKEKNINNNTPKPEKDIEEEAPQLTSEDIDKLRKDSIHKLCRMLNSHILINNIRTNPSLMLSVLIDNENTECKAKKLVGEGHLYLGNDFFNVIITSHTNILLPQSVSKDFDIAISNDFNEKVGEVTGFFRMTCYGAVNCLALDTIECIQNYLEKKTNDLKNKKMKTNKQSNSTEAMQQFYVFSTDTS